MICNITSFSETEYGKEKTKEFCETLTKLINEYVIPNFGSNLSFTTQLGLWTSDEYGSYKIEFFDKTNKGVCYILADTIQGKWEVFKT